MNGALSILGRATTNETLSGGNDIGVALRQFFPSITAEDVTELDQVSIYEIFCSSVSQVRIHKAYPVQAFASDGLRFQTVTGDSELKCAVSSILPDHIYIILTRGTEYHPWDCLLGICQHLGLSVQPTEPHKPQPGGDSRG